MCLLLKKFFLGFWFSFFVCFVCLFLFLGAMLLMQQALFSFFFFISSPPPTHAVLFWSTSSMTAHYCFFLLICPHHCPTLTTLKKKSMPMRLFHGFSIERVITALVCLFSPFFVLFFLFFRTPFFLSSPICFFLQLLAKKSDHKVFSVVVVVFATTAAPLPSFFSCSFCRTTHHHRHSFCSLTVKYRRVGWGFSAWRR